MKSSYFFLFSAFFFLLSPFSIFSQQIDIDENTQNRILTGIIQNSDIYAGLNLNHVAIIENNNQIPAFGLYQKQWDTLHIRSERIEIPFFENQLKIMLIQEGNTPFAFPISGVVSTGFVKNKGRQHAGIDFTVQKREPVVSCFDGVVRVAKKFEEYGNTVVIRHYNALETVYARLDYIYVKSGQRIKAGELIGYIGSVNNVLHFETRFLNEFFNPEKMINFSERKLHDNMLTLTPDDFTFAPESSNTTPLYHTVQKGENIYRISLKYNITQEQLKSLNNIKGEHIEAGQKLRIR